MDLYAGDSVILPTELRKSTKKIVGVIAFSKPLILLDNPTEYYCVQVGEIYYLVPKQDLLGTNFKAA